MPTLYEMTQDFNNILDMLYDPEVPEQAVFDTIELLEMEIEDKADGYAKVIRELEASAEAAKVEAARLTDRKKAFENKAKAMKTNLQEAMLALGKPKIKTALFSFSVQSNPTKVEISDPLQFLCEHPEFKLDKPLTESDINKTAVKAAIEAGQAVDGAQIVQGQSLRIK